jgi:plasmid stability protein
VENRNITITLPAELVRAARIFAAERDTSLNALLREMLQERLEKEGRTRTAVARMLEIAEHGPWSHVDPGSFRREELYERR